MSKKFLVAVAMLIALSLTGTGFTLPFYVLASDCYEPNDIPFVYDSAQVDFKLLGAIKISTGAQIRQRLNYSDPDGDTCIVRLLSAPDGLALEGQDPNIFITWAPAKAGLFYIHLEIEDLPPAGSVPGPLTDKGTIIIKVDRTNQPPAFRPLCGGN
jgi:hypothetical protein